MDYWDIWRWLDKGGGGGGGDTVLAALEVYIADFLEDPPTVTEGAINAYHRILVS